MRCEMTCAWVRWNNTTYPEYLPGGLRDVDPLAQALLDKAKIPVITADEMIHISPCMKLVFNQLAEKANIIYLHMDLDILDASEIPGSFFGLNGGPTA